MMPAEESSNGLAAGERELAELRRLLLGPEYAIINDGEARAALIATVLAEATRLSASRDKKLRKALQSTIEEAIEISVRRNPRMLAEALFPVFGRAMRRAIATEVQNLLASLNQVMEQSLSWRSLLWRWEALRTGRPYPEIILLRSVLYRVDQVLLIHRETGLPLLDVKNKNSEHGARDADMVSGMLTAVQNFMRDSFSSAGEEQLETVRVSNASLVIAHGPQAILAGLVQGTPPYNLRRVFQETVETIHEEHLKALTSFRGETSPFEVCRPLLERCLLGHGEAGRLGRKRRHWILAAVPVLLAALLLAGWWWSTRAQRRWDRCLAQLRAAPGIVVTSSGRRGDKYVVAGLRDPLAADPSQFVKSSGIPEDSVEAHWQSFISAEPRFQSLRRFNDGKAALERRRIRFAVGKSEIVPPQDSMLEEVALDMKELFQTAGALGRQIRFEVRGDTDPAGTEQFNSTLARDRAATVRNALISLGVRADILIPIGRGAARTCTAVTDFERSTCRSASVRVVESGS